MSTQSTIYTIIETVINELHHHPEITVDIAQWNPPTPEESLALETKLPAILQDFYRVANGIELSWHVTNDPIVKGGLVIPLLENIHNTRWHGFGMLDYTDDVHAVFQKRDTEDSRVLAESLVGDEDIEFQEIAGGIVTIADYFAAFASTRGFRFWQETFQAEHHYSINSIIANRGYLWGSESSGVLPEMHAAHSPT